MTFPFHELDFDAGGQPVAPFQLENLIAESRQDEITDLIFLAHGFRCDAEDANRLYTNLLHSLSPHLADMTDRRFGVAGVYWPSKEFPETLGTVESVNRNLADVFRDVPADTGRFRRARRLIPLLAEKRGAQDDFVRAVLLAFDDGSADPAEGLSLLHEFLDSPDGGAELLSRIGSSAAPRRDTDDGGVCGISVTDGVLNRVDRFLNFMSWATMKQLSGDVGTKGLAACVAACQRQVRNKLRIHLVGHSLGGRLMAACSKGLAAAGGYPVDSLSLLEAAFSHFGFSPDAGRGRPGFFREVITRQTVRGPVIATFSKLDQVVGLTYAAASRLAGDRLQAIGDSADPYGGIGHNGAQRTPESTVVELHRAGEPYDLRAGIVTCLDGSAGMIAGHGDVTNEHVTYAIASAIRAA